MKLKRLASAIVAAVAFVSIPFLGGPVTGARGYAYAEQSDTKVQYILTNEEPGYICEGCCPYMSLCCTIPQTNC